MDASIGWRSGLRVPVASAALLTSCPYFQIAVPSWYVPSSLYIDMSYSHRSIQPPGLITLRKVSAHSHQSRDKEKNRGNVLVCFFQETWPVFDRTNEMAHMHHIEGVLGPCPLILSVVDLEMNVWWHPVQ